MQMQKIKKTTNTEKATNKKDENENVLLEYMGDVDNKLFKEYSKSKNFKCLIVQL